MSNESQLLAALLGGFFAGLFMAAIAYMYIPLIFNKALRNNKVSDPLEYVRVVAKYK